MTMILKSLAVYFLLIVAINVYGQENSDWNRHPVISPDGQTILFTYKGDIYSVPSNGGTARPLTIHQAWDAHPVWSRDGQSIAFASDRSGNLDIFIMPASGGKARRLTHHSAADIPTDFSPDGSGVLFISARTDNAASSVFPTTRLSELYLVPESGGTPTMVSTLPMSEVRYNKDGSKILYRDEKCYESKLRKHDTSAFARDIWVHDLKTGAHNKLTSYDGADHTPIWDTQGGVFYLSENGLKNLNVWHMKSDGSSPKRISHFEVHPVRGLSISNGGVLAYTQHGNLFTQSGSGDPQRVAIQFSTDTHGDAYHTLHLEKGITEMSVSPSGKELAFINRGEIFVTSRDFRTTKRITNTAEQERSVSFHKDGRTLVYASDRLGRWSLYESTIKDPAEKYFFASTTIEEKEIHRAETESFQPLYSPDGKKIAYLSARDEIQVLDRATGRTNVALSKKHNYSYSDGDLTFSWSADSKWLAADYATRGRLFVTNIGVFPADGSAEPRDISRSGYQDGSPFWSRAGEVVLWSSSRFGQRDHGSWGREFDIMAAFLSQDSYDMFTLTKDEYALVKELEDEKAEADGNGNKKAKKDKAKKVKDLKVEWEELRDRTVRLTKNSENLGSAVLTTDHAKLYWLTFFDKGSRLWERDLRKGESKLLSSFDSRQAEFTLSADDKTIYVLSGGALSFSVLGDKFKLKPIEFEATMELKPDQERAFMFEHAWRQVNDKFYNPNFHGIDWDAMKKAYQAKLPSISSTRDLANLLEEMTGELNASHIGAYFRPTPVKGADNTASLGVLFDLDDTSGPITIAAVLDKSPLKKAKSAIRAGMKLASIDGKPLDGTTNLASLLNNKIGHRTRVEIIKSDGSRFEEVTIPISRGAEVQLLYERWVKSRRELVQKQSKGRLGYVHVRSMDDDSYRMVYSEILGENFDKEAIIVDTRWNGGGWLHNDLAKLLMGKEYFTMHVRGREYRGDPLDQWNKPSILVMGEGNYSDAHAFPFTYDALDIGEMVGMPVPGTMTAVWWETMISGDIRFGVPQVGMKDKKGEYLENNQTEPDHLVKNDPESQAKGEDKQIIKAVQVMLATLDKKK
ncbi:MAG: tricorn protease [Planctomycetota bacterium]|jgi:tricorn protease